MLAFLTTTSGSLSSTAVVSIVVSIVIILGAIGTAPGRHFIARAFKGQSMEQLTATATDAVAQARDLYEMMKEEKERIEHDCGEKIGVLTHELETANARIKSLEMIVTAKAEVEHLEGLVIEQHKEVMTALGDR